MTNLFRTAPGTESSVPGAGTDFDTAQTFAAFQAFMALANKQAGSPVIASTGVDVPDAQPEPEPAPPSALADLPPSVNSAGFRTSGPWIVGALYIVIPTGGLLPIADDATLERYWYCVTKGRYVCVTLSHALAWAAISSVSGGVMKAYKSQADAIAAFNESLQYHMVTVVA
ncbi:hypothetical protein DFH07DRAFT_963662 [Mycena maculata]|uniref:Uncharacterized protein n=1 Tax=Mycena maculata TaxID=230809 RepID=A0AAD7IKS7_9AGAR|nr:hypothetical protein DFH07DRAFT_963662 [Mycena maculata]